MTGTRASAAGLLLVLLSGCGTRPHERLWGADATAAPGWQRVAAAARTAAVDPRVWVPLAGAAVLQVEDWDSRASDWARARTPLFGSPSRARERSDDLRAASVYAAATAALAAESGDEAGRWVWNKARGGTVDAFAVLATGAATGALKSATGRQRPDGSDRRSLPSGHASGSAVATALASRHLEFAKLRPAAQSALGAGLDVLTLGTAWARVEAGVHYPADVLFGMALGRFLGIWFNDALLDPHRPTQWTVLIYPRADLEPGLRARE